MSEPNTISLLLPPEASSKPRVLQSQIQQVIAQKGHFRHVTESSLLAELHGKRPASDALDAVTQGEAEAAEDESSQKRQERLWKRREEMLERLNYAQNEILCALDFVSLLISKQQISAQTSMSPALKEAVPVGSLAGRVLDKKQLSTSAKYQLSAISQGWRSDSFKSASEKLSAASTRLKSEAERESKYWAQIADLTARGWPVSRLPRDRKAVGAHFGFAESASQFRDRGFALLRQSDDGTVILESQAIQRRRKRLGVSVIRNDIKTGLFHFRAVGSSMKDDIHQQLTEARDSLFEEELFYEICREARTVANQGIATRGQSVEMDVGNEYHLSLTFADNHENGGSMNARDSQIAQFVGISLHLLLNAAHEQNLIRRSQRPPTMTLKPRPAPEYALIRPLLGHLRHTAEAAAFWKASEALITPLKRAGLPIAITTEGSKSVLFKSLNVEVSSNILSDMMLPANTTFNLNLATGRSMQFGIATFLGPPLFGTRYESSPVDFGFSHTPLSRYETQEAAISFLRRVIILEIVAHIQILIKQMGRPQASNDPDKGKSKQWKVSQPHNGELTLYDAGEAVRKIQVSVQPQFTNLKLSTLEKAHGAKNIIWSWTAVGCSRAEGTEVVLVHGDAKFDDIVTWIAKEDR